MNGNHYAAAAARLLRRSLPRQLPRPAAREHSLATIERALDSRRRRRVRIRLLSLAAAALVCLGVGTRLIGEVAPQSPATAHPPMVVAVSPMGNGASILRLNGEERLEGRVELASGSRIATAKGGGATLSLSTGTHLELESETTLSLHSQERLQRFSLMTGVLNAAVTKLASGERFVVDTPDAQVEVRGTAFRLDVLPPARACGQGGARTRLEVREGVVEVRAAGLTTRVLAGEHWPLECEADARATRTAAEQDASAAASLEPSVPPPAARAAPDRPRISSLRHQNELFEQALHAQRGGDYRAALRAYDALLGQYPASALAENAVVGRMRILGDTNRSAAAAEAERYLERYPHGFAREEAQRQAEARSRP